MEEPTSLWDYSQLSNYIYIYLLDEFYRDGVVYFNGGGTGGHKGLNNYKMHYPHFNEQFYSYTSIKDSIEMKTMKEWI